MLTPILRTVLPSDCFACGRPLEARQRMGACLECWASLDQIEGLNCRRCGAWLPIGSDLLGPWPKGCAHCLRQEPIFGGVLAAGAYRGSSRLFLLRGKLAGRPEILRELGRRLAVTAIVRGFGTGCTAVVPVPSHPWARWTRGFNPAEEISRALARTLHLPMAPGYLRARPTAWPPRKRRAAGPRRAFLAGAFKASGRARGAALLLVDDVLTTGATATACAKSLLDAGASKVHLAVWASTPARF